MNEVIKYVKFIKKHLPQLEIIIQKSKFKQRKNIGGN